VHHLFDGHEFEQAPGVGDGQGGNLKKMNPQPMESDLSLDRQCQI